MRIIVSIQMVVVELGDDNVPGRKLYSSETQVVGDDWPVRNMKVGKALAAQYHDTVSTAMEMETFEELHVIGEGE